MEEKEEEKKTFWQKYYKIIAIIILLLAILLLIYTVYRVLPRQRGGRKIKGGSCGCAAGASQDNLPMGYGGMFRI